MELTEDQKKSLQRIDSGKTTFEPEDGTDTGLQLFQATVKDLIKLEEYGYITINKSHQEDMSGNRYYDRINCSLTDEGRSIVNSL